MTEEQDKAFAKDMALIDVAYGKVAGGNKMPQNLKFLIREGWIAGWDARPDRDKTSQPNITDLAGRIRDRLDGLPLIWKDMVCRIVTEEAGDE